MAGVCADVVEVAFQPPVVEVQGPVVQDGAVVGCTTTASNYEHKMFQLERRNEWRRKCGKHNICHMFKHDDGTFECKACSRMTRDDKYRSPRVLVCRQYSLGKYTLMVEEQHHWQRQRINYDIVRGLLGKKERSLMQLTKWFKRRLQRVWFMYILWRRSFHRSLRHRLLRQWFVQFQQRQTFMHYLQHRWFTRYQRFQQMLSA